MTRPLAFLIVCVQACLIQNVFSQCSAGPYGLAGAYGAATPCGAAYGGAGVGNVAVAGQLPVCGRTAIAGQVPIIGAVSFGGPLPAAGAVTIVGDCACGCGAGGPYGIY